MIFAIIENGVFVKRVDDAAGNYTWDATHYCTPSALTPDEKAQFGVVPFIVTVQPAFNSSTQTCVESVPTQINGAWMQQWTVTALPLVTAQSNLLNQLEPQRLIVQSKGLSYTFPDGTVGIIQTRDPLQYPDILNINSYALMGTVAASQGISTMAAGFIDSANITHAMTPAQAIAMGVAVSAFVGATYAAKQNIRAAINALTAPTITTFDITQGWPT